MSQKKDDTGVVQLCGPSKADVLRSIAERSATPSPFVVMQAARLDPAVYQVATPEEPDVDREGWVVSTEREWRLEVPGGVRLVIDPSAPVETILAELDRLRREIQARPEIVAPDWTVPLPTGRHLHVLRGGKDEEQE